MELVLIIKNSSYANPYSINPGSSVACTFDEGLESHPLLPRETVRKRRRRKQAAIPK